MQIIPDLDYFLAAFFIFNLALVFFSKAIGRAWSRISDNFHSEARQRELQEFFSGYNLKRMDDPAGIAKTIFWSGVINCLGIAAVRIFFIPQLH